MIAALPMYDHPAQAAANDRLWRAIAGRLRTLGVADVPDTLTRGISLDQLWRDPALLFGQACGYPLVTERLPLRLLATPVYRTPGSADGRHRSLIVARTGDPDDLAAYRGRRAAINDRGSNTGMNLFRATIAPLGGGPTFFAKVIVTGAHRASIVAVGRGDADIAAIDAITHTAIAWFEPTLIAPLKVIGETPASPTLPFVTAAATPPETVAALHIALAAAIDDPALAETRDLLSLTGIVPARADAYEALADLAHHAAWHGYPELC